MSTIRVTITDKDALRALSWKAVKAYLEASAGWHRAREIPQKGIIYQYTDKDDRLWEIAVLTRDDLADYAARMGDAVGTLARVEDRSELDVYEDLRALGAKLESHATEEAEPPPPEVDEATRAAHERIRKWLAEEGWHVRDVGEPQSSFNIMAALPDGPNVNIFQYKKHVDHITLSQHCVFDEGSRSEIARLPITVQRETVNRIYRDVSIMGVDLSGLSVPSAEMTICTYVYFDGLSKDTLIQRILLTIRALSISLQTFVLALEEAVYSPEVEGADRPVEQVANGETGYSVQVTETDDPAGATFECHKFSPTREGSCW